MDEPQNPYAPPKHDPPGPGPSLADGSPASPGLDRIRQEHINAETNIKGLGGLLYLATAVFAIRGIGLVMAVGVLGLINVALAGVLGLTGYLLRRLDPRGRLVYTGFVALGAVFIVIDATKGVDPLTTALSRLFWPFLFVAALWTRKASTVFTPHYREVVVPATPNIKAKTSILFIVLVVILLALVVAIVIEGAS